MNNHITLVKDDVEYRINVDEYGCTIVVYDEYGKVETSLTGWSEDVVLVNTIGVLVENLNLIMNNASLLKNNPPNNTPN